MKQMKLLTIVLLILILGAGGVVFADEVINIDLNGYNDANAYTGTAVVDDGINLWRVYYGDWGKPMGSPRSDQLADYDEPGKPGIYAAQVWIGDPGTGHWYQWGSELMDDGFIANPPNEPNISLFGEDAYEGTFDIYVYGANEGNFTLESPIYDPCTKHVDANVSPGEFIEGGNYVIFPDILINEGNAVYITYTNVINGLQLVKLKQPVPIQNGTEIIAPDYDVAYDTNLRSGEPDSFGPDEDSDNIVYIHDGEYMEYDITVDDANEGRYDIKAWVMTFWDDCTNLNIYLDDIWLGVLVYEGDSTGQPPEGDFDPTPDPVSVNLFEGSHTFKWAHIGGEYGYDLSHFKFTRTGEVIMNDCNDVNLYGLNYAGDLTGDCRVDFYDFAVMAEKWMQREE